MGGAEVSIRGQKASIIGVVDVNVTDRVARILGQLTDGVNVIDPRDRNWDLNFATDQVDASGSTITSTILGTPDVNVTDRAARLLGIIYGSQNQQLLQRAVTFDLQTQLRTAGVEYDARDRNWDLDFATDQVDVSGSTINIVTAPTTPILDYNTDTIGRNESNIHTYTATGNFKLSRIEVSAAGSMKIEIKAGNAGSETTKMVGFTSPSKPVIQLDFDEELQLSANQNILIIRTNRENYDLDVYSTVLGFNT